MNFVNSISNMLITWTSLRLWKPYTLVEGFIKSPTGSKGVKEGVKEVAKEGSSESPVHTYNFNFASQKQDLFTGFI